MIMLRRNDVVYQNDDNAPWWTPYGRVWRRLDDEHVLVIFLTKDIRKLKDTQLTKVAYKGRWDDIWDYTANDYLEPVLLGSRWKPMPTLRWMKRNASKYNAHFGGCSRYSLAERKQALKEVLT